ncbi:dTDP-4-dehydrorhamnose reductase [Patescibacteria group bacterium]|nr:dTDP-4-dehydrorhamnose reductase [Patescibacteria group bacterium]
MAEKILILGSNGMLGRDLVQAFLDFDVTAWDIEDLDITDSDQIVQKISELKPEIIINATGYTNVDGAETNEELANQINGHAVGELAKTASQIDAILVSISTEYVFDGQEKDVYDETSKPNPINVYGKSKALGEELLQKNCQKYYLVRSSWLYGKNPQVGKPRGMNFVDLMLKLAAKNKQLEVVDDQFGKPTYTVDLAQAVLQLIENKKPFGIYHLVNEAEKLGVSWYEFAQKIFALKNITVDIKAVKTAERPDKAKRPEHAVLINTKAEKLSSWEDALREYLK